VLAVVVLAATRVDAAAAAPVPCKAAGGGHYNCQFYVAGNGRSGGTPWQLWVPSQPENTTERLVNNRSFLGKNVWGQTLQVDRSSRAGQQLCVKWWRNDKPGSGRWSDRGKACVTISR
jgi:hypothetical protein